MSLNDLVNWSALSRGQRALVRDSLAKTLRFAAGDLVGPHELAEVIHPSGIRFVAIPGGTYEMGMRDADLKRVAHLQPPPGLTDSTLPVHFVTIKPFLCARSPLRDANGALRFMDEGEATEVLGGFEGFRVMSEAEWEYVARNGGVTSFMGTDDPTEAIRRVEASADLAVNPTSSMNDETAFGIAALPWGEYVADAWHDSYEGAPTDGRGWDPPDVLEYWRGGTAYGYPYQQDWDVVECLAAFRPVPPLQDPVCLRLARDLPTN